jgi:predicted ATPase
MPILACGSLEQGGANFPPFEDRRELSMQRHILTGAPGAGKTVILRALERAGLHVVEEAATDVIALAQAEGIDEPHRLGDFTETICALQIERQRRAQAAASGWPRGPIVFDRSPICTAALAEWLGHPIGPVLAAELARIESEGVYARDVLFVETLGYVTPTAARRIGYADTLRFEAVHRRAYAERGYRCISIAPGSPSERARAVMALIGAG